MVSQMEDLTSSRAFRMAGARAFETAGIQHSDVDHLMVYDAFAHLPLYGLEDLGFVARGGAADFVWGRNTAPGGALPMNTNGGGLSYMHSGMYGMYALQESVRQLRGRAPAQVEDARISFCLGVGGMFAAAGAVVLSTRCSPSPDPPLVERGECACGRLEQPGDVESKIEWPLLNLTEVA